MNEACFFTMDVAGAEAKAAFMLRLRARGIRDLAVLRALESVPRDRFVPHRYADLAAKDVALPIPCGQTMSEPFFVARMVEALRVTPSSRVLEIGAGSGYTSAILARLAGEVIAFERYQSLAIEARTRLEGLGLTNACIVWGDGLAVPPEAGTFDRLIIHAVIETVPSAILARLADDAVMVYAQPGPAGQRVKQQLVSLRRRKPASPAETNGWQQTILCPARLRALDVGRSHHL